MFLEKKKLPQLDGDEISQAFSIARRMGLEYQLNKMGKVNASLKEIRERMKAGIEQLRSRGDVGPSFSFAKISHDGF